jgi:CubicO group peptidase (beta-lactamase class C family)
MSQPTAPRPAVPVPLLSRRDLLRLAAASGAASALGLAPAAGASAMPVHVPSSRPATQPLDDAFAELGVRMRAVMERAHVPGAAVGILLGEQEASAGFGVTSVDYPRPVDADTLFQIGSITKTYTATALMRLVDQGQLELDAPVRHYVPELQLADPDVADRLTLHHLLTHTSGLPADDFRAMGGGDDALARYAASLAEHPLLLPLGFAPSYSNIGFSLAGRVLEVVADRPYETAIKELVFDPLGMERAFFFAEDAILYPTSAGHGVVDNAAQVQRPWGLPRTANAAGGIVLSLRDQLRYARFWLGDGATPEGQRLLSREAMALMQTPQARDPEGLVTFGLPWALRDLGGEIQFGHDGGTMGQAARLGLMPARGLALCVLTNSMTGGEVLGDVTTWAQERLLGFPGGAPADGPVLALSDTELATYAGEYDNPGETRYTLTVRDGGLEMGTQLTDPFALAVRPALPAQPPLQLAFETPNRVHAVDAPMTRGAFLRHPDGSVAGMFFGARFYRRLA